MRYDIISGDQLVVGNDYGEWDEVDEILAGYDIIGAPVRGGLARPRFAPPPQRRQVRLSPQQAAFQAAAQVKRANAGVIVREQAPTKARRIILPMESTGTVAAAAAATITARPQTIAFKPTRIVIPSTIAPDFIVTDIKVGVKSQLAQSGNLPGEAFLPNVQDGEMEMDTVQTSQDFVLQIQNISGVARQFRAGVYGTSVEQ